MTNINKYKTAEERTEAFWKYYAGPMLPYEALLAFAKWLDLEAEKERLLPCPYCGCECLVHMGEYHAMDTYVSCCSCGYRSKIERDRSKLIDGHNRVAQAAMDADKKESI